MNNSIYYIHKPEIPAPCTDTIQYRSPDGKNIRISAEKFRELTGAQYVTYSFPSDKFVQSYQAQKQYYSLTQEATDENVRLIHIQGENAFVGLGIVTARVIRCGEAICHYNGQFNVQSERGSDFQLYDVDAGKFRNLGAMVNHSFPNTRFENLDNNGFPEWILIALDTFDIDQEVFVNYGHTYEKLTLGRHAELRYDAAAAFVKSSNLFNDSIGAFKNVEKWHYLATNPSLLIDLYFNGDWPHSAILSFLGDIAVTGITLPRSFEGIRSLLNIGLGRSHDSLQMVKELKPGLYKKIAHYFREAGRMRSAIGAVYALRMLPTYLPATLLQDDQWLEITSKLDAFISAWEHINANRLADNAHFTDNTPLHRAIRTIQKDPCLHNLSLA